MSIFTDLLYSRFQDAKARGEPERTCMAILLEFLLVLYTNLSVCDCDSTRSLLAEHAMQCIRRNSDKILELSTPDDLEDTKRFLNLYHRFMELGKFF